MFDPLYCAISWYVPLFAMLVVMVYAPFVMVPVPTMLFPSLIVTVPSGTFLPYLSLTVPVTFTFPAVLFCMFIVVVVGILATLIVGSVLDGWYVLFPGYVALIELFPIGRSSLIVTSPLLFVVACPIASPFLSVIIIGEFQLV